MPYIKRKHLDELISAGDSLLYMSGIANGMASKTPTHEKNPLYRAILRFREARNVATRPNKVANQ